MVFSLPPIIWCNVYIFFYLYVERMTCLYLFEHDTLCTDPDPFRSSCTELLIEPSLEEKWLWKLQTGHCASISLSISLSHSNCFRFRHTFPHTLALSLSLSLSLSSSLSLFLNSFQWYRWAHWYGRVVVFLPSCGIFFWFGMQGCCEASVGCCVCVCEVEREGGMCVCVFIDLCANVCLCVFVYTRCFFFHNC